MCRIIDLAPRFLFLIMFISVSVEGQGNNNSPYSFSKDLDMKIVSVSGGLLLGSVLVDHASMDLEEIAILNSDDISDYDVRAIKNWDLKSIKMSDLLLYSSIAVPGLLLTDKIVRNDYRNFSLLWAESVFLTLGITNLTLH